MIEELKNCPFCNTPPIIQSIHKSIWVARCTRGTHVIETRGKTEQEATVAWNRRAEPYEIPGCLREYFQNQLNIMQLAKIPDEYCETEFFRRGYCEALEWALSLKMGEE